MQKPRWIVSRIKSFPYSLLTVFVLNNGLLGISFLKGTFAFNSVPLKMAEIGANFYFKISVMKMGVRISAIIS